ncbi:hypothetical protein TNCV_1395801 [Trichonephila clavipes]|nr:hypothetical protein TNCV_1395801 [Trichonephila clavipes]
MSNCKRQKRNFVVSNVFNPKQVLSARIVLPVTGSKLYGLEINANGVQPSKSWSASVARVLERGWHVMSSSPVPLKTRRIGDQCTLNLSRAQASSR